MDDATAVPQASVSPCAVIGMKSLRLLVAKAA
jgi:hypothetical protein